MRTLEAGARLVDGRYRLEEVLGVGGAAVVRRAHDERLRRDVAIKLFHPGTTDQHRHGSELALMASLAHPALVRMYDGGQTPGQSGAPNTYLVMEYVPGPTMHRALDAGAMSRARVAGIGAALASALAYLHGRGVVHRDVKPGNVLLTRNEPLADEMPAKLGDFGIARMLDGARVTATGQTVGTANYLSPEQVLGHAIGPASDVYSLGLVMLEALTGQIVYPGSGVVAALARLDRPPVVPDTFGPAWTSLLTCMLDADPAARPDAMQVRRELGWVETSTARDVDPDATTSAMAVAPGGTAALPARHRSAPSWPDSYLLDAPRRLRRSKPMSVFLLMGATAAAIIVAVLAAALPSGSNTVPPTPSTPAAAASPSSANASDRTQSGATADQSTPTTAPATVQRAGITDTAAPTASIHQGPVAPVHGHGKAKGHTKHDDS